MGASHSSYFSIDLLASGEYVVDFKTWIDNIYADLASPIRIFGGLVLRTFGFGEMLFKILLHF
jgi:hypothetical protein